jgi:hypothetical protein
VPAGIVAEQAQDELRGAACGEGEAKVLSERVMLQVRRAAGAAAAAAAAAHCRPTPRYGRASLLS